MGFTVFPVPVMAAGRGAKGGALGVAAIWHVFVAKRRVKNKKLHTAPLWRAQVRKTTDFCRTFAIQTHSYLFEIYD